MNVTAQAKAAVEAVENVKKAISIAAAAVQLGAAVSSQNPAAIRSALNSLCVEATA